MNEPDLKVLWAESGKMCSMCHALLIDIGSDNKKYPLGEMAHIKGEKKGAARYDEFMDPKDREAEPNRILLCPTCHTKIDKDKTDKTTYTVELLHKYKADHIKWVEQQLQISMANLSFAELEVVLKYLIDSPLSDSDMTLVPIGDKVKKNKLSQIVDKHIKIGLMQRNQINDYINKNVDPKFSERLRSGFIEKYLQFKKESENPDTLFYDLWNFASNYSSDFNMRAAGLSVVSYFFELCDIFEK